MTDTIKLKCEFLKSRLTTREIAQRVGMTYYSLQKKTNNVVEFKPSEIMALCKVLKIEDIHLRDEIFFSEECD